MTEFLANIIISRKQYKDFSIGAAHKFRPLYAQPGFWIMVLLPLLGLYVLLNPIRDPEGKTIPYAFFCFGFPAAMLLQRVLAPYKAGRAYDNIAHISKPVEHIFNEQQVKLKGHNFEKIYPWSEATKLQETKDYLLLYMNKTNIILLPMTELTDEEVAFIKKQFARRNG